MLSGLAIAALVTLPVLASPPVEAIPGVREFSGNLIVKPRRELDGRDRRAAERLIAARVLRHYASTDEYLVEAARIPEALGVSERQLAARLEASGLFAYVEPDWILYPVVIPDDPRYPEQWHHTMIGSPEAWELSVGCEGMIVAVTDTGIVDHEDLTNRVPGYNAVSDIAEADGGDMTDIHGHGVHVLGCAAATGDNGIGVAGVGWSLAGMPIRVSEAANGGASMANLLEGARWAAEHGAKVVSASYSGIGATSIETTGLYLRDFDASLLWAAGNSHTDHAGWDFENVLVIGASDSGDNPAGFSSYGRGVDLFAPGVGILSTTRDGLYAAWSGTSMATPVANGALAIVRCVNPDLTAIEAEQILKVSCEWWGGFAETEEFGFGRIDLARAVEFAQLATTPQPPVANDDVAAGVTSRPRRIDVLSNDYDLNFDELVIVSWSPVTSMGDPVQLIAGEGPHGAGVLEVVPAPGAAAGLRSFEYTIEEPASGETASATVYVTLSIPTPAEIVVGSEPGLLCDYYALSAPQQLPDFDLLTPYLSEVVAEVNYGSTGGDFAGSGRADEVGAVYTGWIEIPEDGLWTLATSSDDGSQLWLGDDLVVDNDGLHGMQTRAGVRALSAGLHPMRLEFFENGGGAGLVLLWSGPSTSTRPIPSEALRHGGVAIVAGDLNGDGNVDGLDLTILLAGWGSCSDCDDCPADLDGNCIVDGLDLAVMLASWDG